MGLRFPAWSLRFKFVTTPIIGIMALFRVEFAVTQLGSSSPRPDCSREAAAPFKMLAGEVAVVSRMHQLSTRT